MLDIFGSHITMYLNIKTDKKKLQKALISEQFLVLGSSDVDTVFCSQRLSDRYKELDLDGECFLSPC